MELAGRALRSQFKQADKVGAQWFVILGGERGQYDAAVKNMESGSQEELSGLAAESYIDAIAEAVQR